MYRKQKGERGHSEKARLIHLVICAPGIVPFYQYENMHVVSDTDTVLVSVQIMMYIGTL